MEKPGFLKEKYNLHNTSEVDSAAERTEVRTGEKVPQDPTERIQNYLDRFKEIIDRKDTGKRERGMEALKQVLHDKFIINPEEIPEAYFENQRRIAREQGHGEIQVTQEMRDQLSEVIVADQRSTLDNWIDYLSSSDATYPDWLKYYAFRSVLGMGEYDKEKKQFAKRSKGTTKPFPDINREALAYVLDAISQKYGKRHTDLLNLNEEERKDFEKLLQGENFSKLYAWAIDKLTIAPQESLEKVEGKWVKYKKKSDHMPLVESLRGHGTGWCTAGESTAEAQLKGGDFYVYYSLDQKGKPTIPRAAIRMQESQIAEVRGIAPNQNLDPYVSSVVQEKLKEFPDGKIYEKKAQDMKVLTSIESRVKEGQELKKDDLIFLYEINSSVEGFGYQRDPRIEELRSKRNPKEDAPIVLDCKPEEIAYSTGDVDDNTKAYIGKLPLGIFDTSNRRILPEGVEHIYTSFPEGKIRRMETVIGGKNKKELKKELVRRNIQVTSYATSMIDSKDFTVQEGSEKLELVRLTVKDLGFPNGATTQEIFDKAKTFGLDLCPAEVGPQLRLQYEDQPLGEWLYIAMKQITDSGGGPLVFCLVRDGDGLWLDVYWALPDYRWYPEYGFVFCLRK